MPNTKSAAKRVRSSEKRRQYNRSVKTSVKTATNKVQQAITDGDAEQAAQRLREAAAELDRAAKRGVIHPNKAARKKARLAKKLNRATG